MLPEATNAIYQRLRTTDPIMAIPLAEAAGAIVDLLDQPLEVLAPFGIYGHALDFATAHRLPSVYDAIYVVLAQMLGAELWTADQRLLTALNSAAPWVRDIASYPLA